MSSVAAKEIAPVYPEDEEFPDSMPYGEKLYHLYKRSSCNIAYIFYDDSNKEEYENMPPYSNMWPIYDPTHETRKEYQAAIDRFGEF